MVLDGSGQAVLSGRFPTGENGRVKLASVPAGAWELIVGADGAAAADISVTAPGPVIPVALAPSCVLEVRVPALADGTVPALLTISGTDGRPFRTLRGFGGLVTSWPLDHGRVRVAGVPPGTWSLAVSSADGKVRTGIATTQEAASALATLD